MAFVLCFELIFGEGLKAHGPAERAFLAAKSDLQAAAEAQAQAAGVSSLAELADSRVPEPHQRTARVNLLRWTVADALAHFRSADSHGGQSSMKARLL